MARLSKPLFRPEAIEDTEFGEAFSFSVPSWRRIALVPAVASLLFGGFALFAQFDRTAEVRGTVAPVSGIARIVAPQPGIVSQVFVKQGQRVVGGAAILKIASPNRLPSGASERAVALNALRLQQRLIGQSIDAERSRQEAEQSRLGEQLAELSASERSYDGQIRLQEERIRSNEERLARLSPLRPKGYVPEATYLALEDSIMTQRQQLATFLQSRDQARHESRRIRLQMSEVAAVGRREELQGEGTLIALQRGAAEAQIQAEVMLAAPLEGAVSSLVGRPGMAVSAGQELATVTRPEDSLEAVLFIPSRAAGSLRVGQDVTLRYDAFPHQRFGLGHGKITEIATSANIPQPGGEPSYRVRVRLSDTRRFALRPDMALTASIVVESRTLLDWLFSPLREKWRERQRPL